MRWLAVLLVLWPASAAAHSLDFGVLRVVETEAGAELVLRASGHEGVPPDVTLATRGGCVLEGDPHRAAAGDRIEVSARCRGSLEGTTLEVRGMSEQLSVALRVRRRGGAELTATLDEGHPRFTVVAGGEDGGVFVRYLRHGAEHLVTGFDHVLFVVALLLLVLRRKDVTGPKAVLLAVTGFTLGHSVTLAAQVLGDVSLPSAPVEACIALSIVLLAVELARPPAKTLTQRHPALVAAAFGLLHGFGFAGALSELGWPSSEAPTALLGFNLGLELAQLGLVALAYPAAKWLARGERVRAPAYVLGTVGAFWLISRASGLLNT